MIHCRNYHKKKSYNAEKTGWGKKKKKSYLGVRVISPREIIEMDHKQCAHLNLIHVVKLLKKFHVGPTKIK